MNPVPENAGQTTLTGDQIIKACIRINEQRTHHK
jgi:hypothetical protein